MMNRILRGFTTSIMLFLLIGFSAAEVSSSTNLLQYYSAANNKSGDAIRTALEGIIDGHTVVSYDNLYLLYVASDSRPDGSLWDMYSTCSWQHGSKKCGNYSKVCDCYNREHSVPQSWFNEGSPMKSDAFHVYPTDGKVNNQRSNYMFGECSGGVSLNSDALGRLGSSTFTEVSYSGKVFEPDDEYKGDFARTYFYMATRYASKCSSWGNHFGSANSGLTNYSVALFLKWHREDPVSEKELIRNEAIYGNPTYNSTGYKQGNRNPFIDYPCLAEYIWGEHKGEVVDFSKLISAYSTEYSSSSDKSGCLCENNDPIIVTPKQGTTVFVGDANLNETRTTSILVSGRNLVGNVTLSISGSNASCFSVSQATLTASAVNNGTYITLSYRPTTIGNHTATLTIASQGATTITATLNGACKESIVSPIGTIYFETEDATSVVQEEVLVKGTNLVSGLTLTLKESTKFSLSQTSFTANEIKNGTNVTITYTPEEVGSDTAKLVATSGSISTTTILVGACTFEALPATELTQNSFVANWTNAGTESYSLNVYTKEIVGTEEAVLMEDPCNQSTEATTSGSVNYDVSECVRLGSGSKTGSITYSGLDVSDGCKVVVNAKYYSNDTGTQMKVTVGDVSETFDLTADFADYELIVPANSANTSVSLKIENLATRKRVNVNNVKVIIGGTVIDNVSISGYPKNVGNVQYYLVEGVNYTTADYYYTVTPLGHSVSNEILVEMQEETESGMDVVEQNAFLSYLNGNVWIIEGIEKGSVLTLMNVSGVILERTVASSLEQFSLPMQGVYILHIERNGVNRVLKIAY
ncbi:MAG: endonuclease [Paludibacteraceae bacterium]|nr:endonuclease [Paludibacteraceae bacterium]